MPNRILHVVSVADSLPSMLGEHIDDLKVKEGVVIFIACSPSDKFRRFATEKSAIPLPTTITRRISPFLDIIAFLNLIRQIRKYKIDAVVGHTPKGGLLAMLASYFTRVQLRIYVRHGVLYETAKTLITKFFFVNIERLTGRLATNVVCVSRSIQFISERDRLNRLNKNVLLGIGSFNGVDAIERFNRLNIPEYVIAKCRQELSIDSNDFVFGFVGRIVNDKGVAELISAWKLVLKYLSSESLKLIIIGEFEDRDRVNDEIRQFIHNEPTIVYVESTKDVCLFYSLMDVFVFPSHREGLPTVVLEASAMEIPIIVTKVTGCIDSIVDGETGIYCQVDPSDIAEKMKFYFDNRDVGKRHGRQGRNWVLDSFAQRKIWDEFWNNVLNRGL